MKKLYSVSMIIGGGVFYQVLVSPERKPIIAFLFGCLASVLLVHLNSVFSVTLPLLQRILSASIVILGMQLLLNLVFSQWLDLIPRFIIAGGALRQCLLLSAVLLPVDGWSAYFLFGEPKPEYPII